MTGKDLEKLFKFIQVILGKISYTKINYTNHSWQMFNLIGCYKPLVMDMSQPSSIFTVSLHKYPYTFSFTSTEVPMNRCYLK